MAKALVVYYSHLEGLSKKPNKELTMDADRQGILLVEADANVSLDQLGDFVRPSCPYAKEFLYDVPGPGGITECPLLLVQISCKRHTWLDYLLSISWYGLGWRGGKWYADRKFRKEQMKLLGRIKPKRWQLKFLRRPLIRPKSS
ncbi:Methanol O-anthraniloyltransferase [Camellia lanceoleosa]|uniref:Methanol O-anthraniloyltransferase n=1 Tax=Camellia lanceoleosa TaxID=1840588 RepID=A0ACC0FGY3_9ERIC|nr:Methanol O-anthraniloyltransferase [Camellia lanceoleosa]